jgi:hypothetical protein
VFGLIDYPSAKAGLSRGSTPASAPAHGNIGVANMAIMVSSPRYALVVSHDCDFNEDKRDFFLAASLHELTPKDRKPERLEKLRLDNDARRHTAAHQIALRAFLIEPIAGHFDEPQLAVFDTITPIAMKFKAEMLKLKRAEMDHEHRVMLREKLALFVARQQDDIAQELKVTPPEDPAELEWQDDLVVGS